MYNPRGTAGTPVATPHFYSASYTGDLRTVIRQLEAQYPRAPLVACGYSLGANILCRCHLLLRIDDNLKQHKHLKAQFLRARLVACGCSLGANILCRCHTDATKGQFKQLVHFTAHEGCFKQQTACAGSA